MNGKLVSNAVWFLTLPFVLVVLPGSARASVITTGDVDPGGAATQLNPWLTGSLKVGDSGTGTLDVATGAEVSSCKGYIGYATQRARQSDDWEAYLTLWDGTKAIGADLYNYIDEGVLEWVTISDGVHDTQPVSENIKSPGSLFSIGQSGQFALEFELTKSSSQVSASGVGASL